MGQDVDTEPNKYNRWTYRAVSAPFVQLNLAQPIGRVTLVHHFNIQQSQVCGES